MYIKILNIEDIKDMYILVKLHNKINID